MKRIFALIIFLFAVCLGAVDDFKSLETFKARLPLYNKGRLQLFMYGKRIKRSGTDIFIHDALLDIIKRNVSVDDVTYFDELKVYGIDSPVAKVADFWKDKQHTDGILKTPLAIINQTTKMARGKEKVYFRSPSLDIDGIGFDAEYETRCVNIHRKVRIRIRMDKLGDKGGGNKGRDRDIMVRSHRMNLDFYANAITVDGEVHVDVDGGKITIDCDKIIVFLSQGGDDDKKKNLSPKSKKVKQDKKKKKEEKKQIADFSSFDSGGGRSVSRIECIGNVKVRRKLTADVLKASGKQEAEAGKATYFMKQGKIVLSGGSPIIRRGIDNVRGKEIVLWRDSERMEVFGDCEFQVHVPRNQNMGDLAGLGNGKKMKNAKRLLGTTHVFADKVDINYAKNYALFTGNVEIRDPQVTAESHKLRILLEENPGAKKDKKGSLNIDSPGKSQKELSKIIFTGDVRARNKKISIFCEEMDMDVKPKAQSVNTKKLKSVLGSGGRQLTRVICKKNVRIISHGNKNTAKKKKIQEDDDDDDNASGNVSLMNVGNSGKGGSADCDYARLELLKNRAYLEGKVKVDHENAILNCEKMHIIARKARKLTEDEAEDEEFLQRVSIGPDRELEKIICLEDVVIIRQGDDEEKQFGGSDGRQKATGDKAVLDMDEHKITLDGKGKNRPKLYRGSGTVEGERIILWTDSEKLDIIKPTSRGIVIPRFN